MFDIGQKVICIDDAYRHAMPPGFTPPVKGYIYTIREIYEHPSGITVLLVDEITNQISKSLDREIGFASDRFRPLDSFKKSEEWAEETLFALSEKIEEEYLVRLTEKI